MRKGSDLIGKGIIAYDTGEKIDSIEDLVFDQNTNQLLGFVVDEGGWTRSARVLPLQSVQSIGPDAVIVPARGAVVPAERVPSMYRILERDNILKGTKILTTDGRDLGTMVDLYFDEATGQVEGYEVSGGVFADAYSGRAFMPAPQTLKIGEDAAFVPPEVAALMAAQDDGGIKGAVQSAGETIQEKAGEARAAVANQLVDPAEQRAFVLGKTAEDDVAGGDGTLLVSKGEQISPLAVEAAERHNALDRLYRAAGGSFAAHIAAPTLEQAKGRRARELVRAEQGVIVAAPGQIVTDQVIERARRFDKEAALLQAVGLAPGDAARESAQQAAQSAGGVWQALKEKVGEFQERAAQKTEEYRVEHALGRPVTRVILGRSDQVILNVGEIITHQAVEAARQHGALAMLLDSVYDRTPQISGEELRAPEPGQASLEGRQAGGDQPEPPRERSAGR